MKPVDTLQQIKITSKARRLQSLWPAIEDKLAAGVSHAEILGHLNDNGFELTERTYKSYLYRYRKQRRTTGPERAPWRLTEPMKPQTPEVAQAAIPSASAEVARQKRPPTFDFDPRGIDPKLLK